MYTDLQRREVFHLLFLRAYARAVPITSFILKGGSNLRFFFGSVRYSEHIDLDARGIPIPTLAVKVMAVLASPGFLDALRPFGIERIQPPALPRAKQTETVQRFKVHLLTIAGEDLFTKIEFSRRGLDTEFTSSSVSATSLAAYRLPPIVVPHYTAIAAARQKVRALIQRQVPEARDVFDLYTLSSQPEVLATNPSQSFTARKIQDAIERVYTLEYHQFRDTVIDYLSPEDRSVYDSQRQWDEIRLRVATLLHGGNRERG
ncbi:MAG: nucleotidyl transferase AbiEii/AbiGii toxin family protein [bacterium]